MFDCSDLHVSEYRAFTAMAPHVHDAPSLNVVVDGGFFEKVGGSERNYVPGHVTFCPAGVSHSQTFGASGARQIIVAPHAGWLAYLADCRRDLDSSPYAGSGDLRRLAVRLSAEMRNDDDFSPIAREGILLEIVAEFGRKGTESAAAPKPPAWLRVARDFLHANACTSLSMACVATAAGRHEIHLAREFRRYYGTSIGAYVRGLRTEEAARLLRESKMEISEVALASGFASHAHLCREFKARFGVTPSAYRAASG
jgi:AraC family transcriptional regulator